MRQSLFCLILRKIFYFLPTIHHEKLSQKHLHIFNQPPMNCNILFFVRTFNHSFKHLICPISKHILRQDCPVVNVSLATVLFYNGKGNLFLNLVRMTGLVVSKANVIAKRANLFATVKRKLHKGRLQTKFADNAICIVASPSSQYKGKTNPNGSFYSCLVRMTGLEPARSRTRT